MSGLHLNITQNIINILRNNEDEGFISTVKDYEDLAIKIFKDGAEEEKAWAAYLFKDRKCFGIKRKDSLSVY